MKNIYNPFFQNQHMIFNRIILIFVYLFCKCEHIFFPWDCLLKLCPISDIAEYIVNILVIPQKCTNIIC